MEVSFIGEGEETTDLQQDNDKLDNIMLYRVHLAIGWIHFTTSVVIGSDCIGSCKYNYYMITTTMSPICDYIYTYIFSMVKRNTNIKNKKTNNTQKSDYRTTRINKAQGVKSGGVSNVCPTSVTLATNPLISHK